MPLDRSRGLMRLVGLGKWMPTRNAIRSSQTPLQGGGSCLNGVFEIVCLGCYSGTYRVRTKLWVGMDGMAVRMWMRLGGCGCSRMYPVLSCVSRLGGFLTCATCAYLMPHYLARLILVVLGLGGPIWWTSLSTSRRPLRSTPVPGYQTSCCT